MITSLPGNPKKNTIIVPVIVGRILADMHKTQYTLSLNTTGLKKDYGGNILEEIKYWGIEVDEVNEDVTLADQLVGFIDKNIVFEVKEEEMLTCECQKLEIPLAEVNDARHNARKVEKDGKCIFCNTGKVVTVKNLYMKYPSKTSLNITIFPSKLQSSFDSQVKALFGTLKRVSKIRKTGTVFSFDNTEFNLDPDFTSLLYFKFLMSKNLEILVHSHRYIAHLARLPFMNDGELKVILLPYLDRFTDFYNELKGYINKEIDLILTIAGNFSWKKIDTPFDISVIKAIKKMPDIKKDLIYHDLINSKSLEEFISKFNNNILHTK